VGLEQLPPLRDFYSVITQYREGRRATSSTNRIHAGGRYPSVQIISASVSNMAIAYRSGSSSAGEEDGVPDEVWPLSASSSAMQPPNE